MTNENHESNKNAKNDEKNRGWKRIISFIKTDYPFLVLLVSVGLLLVNGVLIYFTYKVNVRAERANVRAEKIFVAQTEPLVKVNKITTDINDRDPNFSDLKLTYGNYSGFDANQVTIDLKRGDNPYIGEYIRTVHGDLAISKPVNLAANGGEGELSLTWQLPLKKKFDSSKKREIEGYPIFVWIKWENEYGRPFEVIYKYRLHRTKVGAAETYHFIFEETIQNNN